MALPSPCDALRNRTPKTWENSSTTSYACDHASRLLPILHSNSGGTQTQINYVLNAAGNSQGLMFHATLMNLAHMKIGNQVNMEIHEGGTIRLTPLRLKPSCERGVARHPGDDVRLCPHDKEAGQSTAPGNCFHLTFKIVRESHAEAIVQLRD